MNAMDVSPPPLFFFFFKPTAVLLMLFLSPAHPLDLVAALMATADMRNKMKHLMLMVAALSDTISSRNIPSIFIACSRREM